MFCSVQSLEGTVRQSVQEMGVLLFQVKNINIAQSKQALKGNSELTGFSDQILLPLMDLLEKKLVNYAQFCERTVLKRVLKELWKIVISSIEKHIVLPPMTEKTNILPNLPNTKIEDVSRLLKTNKLPTLNMIEVRFFNIVTLTLTYLFETESSRSKEFVTKTLCNSRGSIGSN